ncbi:T9SS type A sorting domain-containing protein [Aquimarina algicola]|uniref:T9SS type A sorting domain-containing protein n=1 Tax=Aquimarina algicola TaxID=2589995 RepID=A0A504J4P1_9FLAO|nr:T9SS type A sorting domain-containing protein [Aquimarina algicola]TPN85926.1 T9SS type A sorting domain-containing protein [Aquimarina algicola]
MKLKLTLLALLICAISFSQNFREVQLPKPENISPLFVGPLFKSTIHYGVRPPNYNGKVIVFNHGYIDLNQGQFLFDNSFYQNTYDAGYQAVFVATTRGEGIWVNGKLLAEAIDIVTEKFNVPQVYLVGHSNGGKASEAALIRYQKQDKVTKAFALGTPFWGTYLADISQLPLLRWAWSLTGLNEGARTSTTYYCRDVVRPYLDNDPNNIPEKFVILGASGYYKGSTIAAPGFLLTGGVLLPVQGANDGVAPYNSTLRPGGEYVFRKNDPRAIFDHLDVGLGQFSWKYVKSYIENPSKKSNQIVQKNQNRHVIESDHYIVYSENEYDKLQLDKNAKFGVVDILHQQPTAQFQVLDQKKQPLSGIKSINNGEHRTTISFSENNLELKSNSKFIAFVKQDSRIKMKLETISKNSFPILKVNLLSDTEEMYTSHNINVTGTITKTAEIDGTPVENEPQVITFTNKDNSFYFDTQELQDGVYSLFANSESNGDFKRSIISGFVVGDIKNGFDTKENIAADLKSTVKLYPNAVKNNAMLSIAVDPSKEIHTIHIYNISGKELKQFTIRKNQQGNYNISDQLTTLQRGIYLLKIDGSNTIKFLKE